ncbi:uncharacterized protein BO80DRAFT_72379 [Aspergillus ibericus CBS 121593]|uniref:Uncharacterized protein n=1 Tax=Aspergillus ibericus CBS 121593 TaxID=1448316 RepID=A0A395H4Q3_9EURO|nr:hypothetical protein BO80DRAFT_72379 [Aspergillus ibericus CBS 121593]RAL01194.1 hypothetical protein BO80DRAFT_72379 [Aspergillus ibericus CBS 121593]
MRPTGDELYSVHTMPHCTIPCVSAKRDGARDVPGHLQGGFGTKRPGMGSILASTYPPVCVIGIGSRYQRQKHQISIIVFFSPNFQPAHRGTAVDVTGQGTRLTAQTRGHHERWKFQARPFLSWVRILCQWKSRCLGRNGPLTHAGRGGTPSRVKRSSF